jgi:cyclophilin family peptidyl-prolyl cis-trans isomerase/uncharacterized protein YkwD
MIVTFFPASFLMRFGILGILASAFLGARVDGAEYSHGDPTDYEQMMLELVNAARANPAAEAARLGIDLNQGLAAGRISADPKPPLAFHTLLIQAARNHSDWMLSSGIFDHTGAGGSTPTQRAAALGYAFGVAENIAYRSSSGALDLGDATRRNHEGLFKSAGHRTNLMEPSYMVVGLGARTGRFEGLNAQMVSQGFSSGGNSSDSGPFLLGVVFDDKNGNGIYDAGEGLSGVRVEPDFGGWHAVTSSSGGFAVPLPPERMVAETVDLPFAVNGIDWEAVRPHDEAFRARKIREGEETGLRIAWSGTAIGGATTSTAKIKRPVRVNYRLRGTDSFYYDRTMVAAENVKVDFLLQDPPAGTNRIVRFLGNGGEEIDIELFGAEKQLTVQNFLNYVESGRYNASIIHRSVPGFVIQGGGFALNGNTVEPVKTDATVTNEPGISNLRGTVAMAKLGTDPNSATSQWFINLADNSSNLDAQNGGFTVFGRVLGNGMVVADRIAGYSRYNATAQLGSSFGELPLRTNALTRDNLILFESARVLAEGTQVIDFDFADSNQGFTGGFADLPADFDPEFYQLVADHRALPSELGSGKGLFLSGVNHSDDLWMFWKKKITGLKPNTLHEVVVDLEVASNVPAGLVGVGGAPGEGVIVKAGASAVEPVVVEDSQGELRLNVDKGNQANGGAAASVLGNIAKEEDSTDNFVRLLRTNRSAKLSATSGADGSLWIFFGTDSGFESTTSVYFTRATFVAAPLPTPDLSLLTGDFLGNFQGDAGHGQVALKIGKGGSFSGSILTPGGRVTFREEFSAGGQASVPVSSLQGTLLLSLKTSGLGDGKWDSGDEVFIEAVLRIGGQEIPLDLRPAPRKGGLEASLVGKTINTLLESRNESGNGFGFGFAGVKPGKDGVFRFAGALADGTKLSGSARAVEDGEGGWKLPVAMPLASVKGFLHGQAAIDSNPSAEGFHLESETPWTWTRPANPRAKAFPSGFTEELNVRGREWTWSKGTSALGGSSANFTLDFTFGNSTGGFVPEVGVDGISATLGFSNKPVWSSTPPKGFTMTITPTTGLVSGKIPGTQNGKSVMLPYRGMLFPRDMPLESEVSPRGAGFVISHETSGAAFITLD